MTLDHADVPQRPSSGEIEGGPLVKVLTVTFVLDDNTSVLDVVKDISDSLPEGAELVTLNLNNQRRFWI